MNGVALIPFIFQMIKLRLKMVVSQYHTDSGKTITNQALISKPLPIHGLIYSVSIEYILLTRNSSKCTDSGRHYSWQLGYHVKQNKHP